MGRPRKKKWISVQDHLPDIDGEYIVYSSTGYRTSLEYSTESGWQDRGGDEEDGYWNKFVTHWMMFPAPPKEEE